MPPANPFARRAPALPRAAACILLGASCGGDRDEPLPSAADVAAASGQARGERAVERSTDRRVVRAREALDLLRFDEARALVEQAAPFAGAEAPLLWARLAAGTGEPAGGLLEALRRIEEARRASPDDPRVYATAAEVLAAHGRLAEADREIQRGLEAAGLGPELVRARGVHLICTPGAARHGLKLLESARSQDPELPFLARPLGQAHLLVAKELAQADDPAGALAAVERSLEHDAADLDARRLYAELLMVTGDWGRGLARYEELLTEGLPLHAELATYCKNAGFWALTAVRDRELALRHYRRALELGLPREELGHGERFLSEEASARVERAAEALAGQDAALAGELVEEALELDPGSLEAWNYKGHAHYLAGELEEAARAWSWVVDTARLREVELPEPVHLKLAQVQALGLGDFEEARVTMETYLAGAPEGAWAERTRELLAALPEPPRELPEVTDD